LSGESMSSVVPHLFRGRPRHVTKVGPINVAKVAVAGGVTINIDNDCARGKVTPHGMDWKTRTALE